MVCQHKDCGRKFHDVGEYFEHVNSHETEEKVEK